MLVVMWRKAEGLDLKALCCSWKYQRVSVLQKMEKDIHSYGPGQASWSLFIKNRPNYPAHSACPSYFSLQRAGDLCYKKVGQVLVCHAPSNLSSADKALIFLLKLIISVSFPVWICNQLLPEVINVLPDTVGLSAQYIEATRGSEAHMQHITAGSGCFEGDYD